MQGIFKSTFFAKINGCEKALATIGTQYALIEVMEDNITAKADFMTYNRISCKFYFKLLRPDPKLMFERFRS